MIEETITLTGSLPWDTSLSIDIDDRGGASLIVRSGSNQSTIQLGGQASVEGLRDMLDRAIPKAAQDRYQRAEISVTGGKPVALGQSGNGSTRRPLMTVIG
ncbi:MAG: hypothetical protein EOO77_19500 [Oxalobacteraceae bacterium]|nr:MAG: hypothetical protein EOO77_19500 [Oxalobacteraceae bacterium]